VEGARASPQNIRVYLSIILRGGWNIDLDQGRGQRKLPMFVGANAAFREIEAGIDCLEFGIAR
jgi:hypothetical protein